jgi:hypothetical protein
MTPRHHITTLEHLASPGLLIRHYCLEFPSHRREAEHQEKSRINSKFLGERFQLSEFEVCERSVD